MPSQQAVGYLGFFIRSTSSCAYFWGKVQGPRKRLCKAAANQVAITKQKKTFHQRLFLRMKFNHPKLGGGALSFYSNSLWKLPGSTKIQRPKIFEIRSSFLSHIHAATGAVSLREGRSLE